MAREQPLLACQKEDFLMAGGLFPVSPAYVTDRSMGKTKTELESDLPALNSTRGKPVSMIDDPELA
jgi:hypothetical protein